MFFNDDIPAVQKKLDAETRELIESRVGRYADLKKVLFDSPNTHAAVIEARARAIASRMPTCQYVKGGATVAEKSFLAINQNPAVIDKIELDIIQARKKPNSIAVRAIMSAGKGHKYWGHFPAKAKEIEKLATEIYKTLFGEIVDLSVYSSDVPRAGQPYSASAFKMILDLVNIFNNVTPAMWQSSKFSPSSTTQPLADDSSGVATVNFLKKVKRVAELVSSPKKGSVGLDPAVYSYGVTGKFHPPAFLASIKFIEELERSNRLLAFTNVRKEFEEFLIRHKSFINQLGHSKGGGTRSVDSVVGMHKIVFQELHKAKKAGRTVKDSTIIKVLTADRRLKDLKPGNLGNDASDNPATALGTKFSATVQAAGVIREVLKTRPKCPICKARCTPNVRSKDHKKDQKLGGKGNLTNLQFTHPYCNHSKDAFRTLGVTT
jgi:hypothetical protein